MPTRTIYPSSSYHLDLPSEVQEQGDGSVVSFWMEGSPLLLQLSSYIRTEGEQAAAQKRMQDRIAKHTQEWTIWPERFYHNPFVDQATADFTDNKGNIWIHTYLVWPHLTIHASISGPQTLVRNKNGWPFQALNSIELTVH